MYADGQAKEYVSPPVTRRDQRGNLWVNQTKQGRGFALTRSNDRVYLVNQTLESCVDQDINAVTLSDAQTCPLQS